MAEQDLGHGRPFTDDDIDEIKTGNARILGRYRRALKEWKDSCLAARAEDEEEEGEEEDEEEEMDDE